MYTLYSFAQEVQAPPAPRPLYPSVQYLIMSMRLCSWSLNWVPTVGLRPATPEASFLGLGAAGFFPFVLAFLAVKYGQYTGYYVYKTVILHM